MTTSCPATRCSRRTLLKAAVLSPLLGLPWLAGCGAEGPLAVAVRPLVRDQFLRLALDLHFVEPADVSLVAWPPGGRAAALADGRLHAATLSLADVLLLRERGLDLVVAAVSSISAGADVILMPESTASTAAVRGARIGLEDTAQAAVMLGLWLDRSGLKRQDVRTVTIGADHAVAWRAGGLDAIVSAGLRRARLEQLGLRVVFDTTQPPHAMIDTFAVLRSATRDRTRQLRAALRGHFRAVRHWRESAQDAVPRFARASGMAVADVERVLADLEVPDERYNLQYLTAPARELHEAAARCAGWLLDAGMIDAPPRMDGLFDPAFLPVAV